MQNVSWCVVALCIDFFLENLFLQLNKKLLSYCHATGSVNLRCDYSCSMHSALQLSTSSFSSVKVSNEDTTFEAKDAEKTETKDPYTCQEQPL